MVTFRVTGGTFTGPTMDKLVGNNITLEQIAQQQPVAAREIWKRLGVCVHPNFANTVWEHSDRWTADINTVGFQNVRGMAATNLPLVKTALANAKNHKLKWMAQVASCKERTSTDKIMARLNYIKENIDDFIAVEGCNEPDRDGLTNADVEYTVNAQGVIWKFVRDNNLPVMVLAPPLRMPAGPELYQRFVDAGILGKYDAISVHHYFGDQPANTSELSTHLDMIGEKWKNNRFWISETGRTTALNAPPTQRPTVSDTAQAKMIVRDFLDCMWDKRVEFVSLYEWLDDPNAAHDDTEKNFGVIQVGTTDPDTWDKKLAWSPLQEFLSTLWDMDSAPIEPIDLEVNKPAGVRQLLVSKADGTTHLWLWRPDAIVWWGDTNRDVEPAPLDVTVYTAGGHGVIPVGGSAVGVRVR